MTKLINLIPRKEIKKEALEDMDAILPAQVERFLDRAIRVIRGYNFTKRKEQFIIAKLIDALDMTPTQLQQASQRLRKYKIVKR